MKKSKGKTIDSFYINKEETTKKTKTSKKTIAKDIGATSGRSQKRKINSNKKKKTNNEENKIINLDNEIIIGLTPKKEEIKSTKKTKNKKTRNTETKIKDTHKLKKQGNHNVGTNNRTQKSKNNKKNKSGKRKNKIIKWILILILFTTAIALFMMSGVFNIKQIIVINNSKIKAEEIINLSTLIPGTNMFKTTNGIIRNNLKTNPYIEDVEIKRNLNGTVTLDIKERKPTYILKFANSYVYINNQGYMLEMSENPLELPMIMGFQTSVEEIKEGNRLIVDDLKKLEDVIKIMETAKSISMDNLITQIDITNALNYILTISSEGKTVQFGDCSNINVKLLKIKAVIEKEKGIAGEIYFQDLDKTIFREKV